MSYRQEFRLTSALDADKLREEVESALADAAGDQTQQIIASDYAISQRAGTGVEPAIVIFASEAAYEVWNQIILPRLKAKYGGAAAVAVDEVQEM